MKRWGIVGVLVLALIGAGLYARDWYFNDKPVDMADDYREDAVPAAGRITNSMDNVYDSFDTYLLSSTIPKRTLKNVDTVDELKRRLVPVLDNADASLLAARKRITTAEEQIKKYRKELLETPSAKFISDSDPIDETEDVADQSRDYLRRIERFIKSYDDYLDHEKQAIDLRRRELQVTVQNQVGADASLEEFTASIDAQLEETKALLKARQKLKPVDDTKDLDENSVEYLNVTIDYLERTQAAFDALDVAGLKAADADYIDEVRRVGRRESALIAKLAQGSGLGEATRSLSKRADDLQDAIAVTGTGEERVAPPRRRPTLFKAPGDSGGDKGSSEGPQEQRS